MKNSRRCELCNVDVHRAPMQKHLRSKKHLENEKTKSIDHTKKVIQRKASTYQKQI